MSLDLILPVSAAQFGLRIVPRAGVSLYANRHNPAISTLGEAMKLLGPGMSEKAADGNKPRNPTHR